MGHKLRVFTLSVLLLLTLNSAPGAAERQGTECPQGPAHCRKKSGDDSNGYLTHAKRQLTEFMNHRDKNAAPRLPGPHHAGLMIRKSVWADTINEISASANSLIELIRNRWLRR